MSNRVSDNGLRELVLLAALDSVQARVDTSVIAEIQNWAGAVVGEFYGTIVKHPWSPTKASLELQAITGGPAAISVPGSAPHIRPGGTGYAQVTASQLISICLSSEDTAPWKEFVRRYKPLIALTITKVARRMGNVSRELVDDLVQDVFIKVCINDFRALKRLNLQHEQAIPGFLNVVARNVAQDYFRGAASAKRGAAIENDKSRKGLPLTEAHDSSSAIEKGVLLKEIDQFLQAFSERDRTVFWLHYRSGLNAKEISQMEGMELTVKGVESLLLRMRRQIWQFLASPISQRKKGT